MRLRDILIEGKPISRIEELQISSDYAELMTKLTDMLIARKPIDEYTNTPDFRKNVRFTGVCGWDGKELLSLDGDDYDIDEEILGYYFQEEDFLVYWY